MIGKTSCSGYWSNTDSTCATASDSGRAVLKIDVFAFKCGDETLTPASSTPTKFQFAPPGTGVEQFFIAPSSLDPLVTSVNPNKEECPVKYVTLLQATQDSNSQQSSQSQSGSTTYVECTSTCSTETTSSYYDYTGSSFAVGRTSTQWDQRFDNYAGQIQYDPIGIIITLQQGVALEDTPLLVSMQTQAGVEAVVSILVTVCGHTFPSPKEQSATRIVMDAQESSDNQTATIADYEMPYSVYSNYFNLSETFSDCPYDFDFSTTSGDGQYVTIQQPSQPTENERL